MQFYGILDSIVGRRRRPRKFYLGFQNFWYLVNLVATNVFEKLQEIHFSYKLRNKLPQKISSFEHLKIG